MESKVKLFGHPVHPMLIVFPLGLLAISVILTSSIWWVERCFRYSVLLEYRGGRCGRAWRHCSAS